MIIVSSSAECKKSSDDDQCYFKVDDLVKSEDGKSIIVKGTPQTQDECTEGGEAQWGMYRPTVGNGGNAVNSPGQNGAAGSNGTWSGGNSSSSRPVLGPTGTSSSISPMATSSGFPSTNSTGNGNNAFGDELSSCTAPVDTKYNLPTACTGEYFDLDLDEALGYGELSADDLAFLREATAGLDSDSVTNISRRAALHRRHIERRLIRKFLKFVKKNIIAPAVNALKTTVNVGVAIAKGAVQLITTGTISGSIKESFSFNLPDASKAQVKQVDSPWGAAILIAAYGTESKVKADKGVQREGYLNIFCVRCGVQGRVELAGRATWSVTQGITQGELEAWADLKAAVKLGVDAQIKLSREWKNNLFQVGLPGLSFGVITIGPQVRLDSRVTLEAQAEGRILAGAEMHWNRAYAKIDLIDPSKSMRRNFDPIPHPIFEAEGSIYLGAELGLPIGLHFGISITSWKKTVALINEPMVKGIAKAAARAELADGKILAGFTPTEGCVGIHANLSWRNRLYGNILDIKEFDIFDTGYKNIKSTCIAIGPQPQKPSVDSGDSTTPTTPQVSIGSSATPQTPTSDDDDSTSTTPNTPSGQDSTTATPQTPPTDGSTPTTPDTPSTDNSVPIVPQTPSNDDVASTTPQTPQTGDPQPSTPDVAQQGDDAAATDAKRSISIRQTSTNNTGNVVPPTSSNTMNSTAIEGMPAGVQEITDSVKNATDVVSYKMDDTPTVPYTREDGYEFTKLLAGNYNVMYCSNGNMYVKGVDQTAGLGCDELFVYSEDAVVGDGAGRYLYYHVNTMQAAGVSRLRLGDEEYPVNGTSAVALVAWSAAETETTLDPEIEGLYFAADYDTESLYWLTFCVYKDGQPPKVFVVEDIEKGIVVLESGDVKYSVTGGDVDKCYPLTAKEDPESQTTWSKFDDSLSHDADGLEFDI